MKDRLKDIYLGRLNDTKLCSVHPDRNIVINNFYPQDTLGCSKTKTKLGNYQNCQPSANRSMCFKFSQYCDFTQKFLKQ